MNETHLHLSGYAPERLWSARWYLFGFPEVLSIAHVNRDVIVVYHDDEPQIDKWVELLRQRGLEVRPVISRRAAA